MSSWCSLFIIPVFHEEDYLCGTYRYVVLEHVGGAWLYELESCSEKRNFSFICARGMVCVIHIIYWIYRSPFIFPGYEFCIHKVSRGTLVMKYSQCKSSIKMLWTKFYNSIKMRFNRRTSLFIFNNHYILLNFWKVKNKRKGTIQRHMQHWTQDTKQRQIKWKTNRKLKIYTEPPTRKKKKKTGVNPRWPRRVSNLCFL